MMRLCSALPLLLIAAFAAAPAATVAEPAKPKAAPPVLKFNTSGNLYTAEVGFGRRAQKFLRMQ